MAAQVIDDHEFGTVTIRRSALARHIKLKIDQRGMVVISMPVLTPLFMAKTLLAQSRGQIRNHVAKNTVEQAALLPGDVIGKSHRLVVQQGAAFASRLVGTELHITLPAGSNVSSREAQLFIKQSALKALRAQSKAYLTRRLETLAQQTGFRYSAVRFSNAGTRWGSCSSTGTISLNIWLMQLPFELIDYVIVHELCHTKNMNHSPQFWASVETWLPDYAERRKALKQQRPYL